MNKTMKHIFNKIAAVAVCGFCLAACVEPITVDKVDESAFNNVTSLVGSVRDLNTNKQQNVVEIRKEDYNTSILVLVFVVLGGIGNIRGSMIAAVVLTVLPELLRGLSDYRMLIYAVVLITMMLFNWAPAAIEWRKRVVDKFKKLVKKEAA